MEVITWKYLMKIKDAVFNPKKSAVIPPITPPKIVPFDVVILNERVRVGDIGRVVSKMEVGDTTIVPSIQMRNSLHGYMNASYGKGSLKTRIVKGTETYRCERIK